MGKEGKTIFIFAGGPPSFCAEAVRKARSAECLIGVDGGANHCLRFGLHPHVILGDFDSIDDSTSNWFDRSNVEFLRFPRKKDATDLELGLDLALEKSGTSVWMDGVLGGRWDMSVANILLAAQRKYQSMQITMFGTDCTMAVLHEGKDHRFDFPAGSLVSFLPINGDINGITITGFEYPLLDETIVFGSSRGISNVVCEAKITERHDSGVLLCVRQDKN